MRYHIMPGWIAIGKVELFYNKPHLIKNAKTSIKTHGMFSIGACMFKPLVVTNWFLLAIRSIDRY